MHENLSKAGKSHTKKKLFCKCLRKCWYCMFYYHILSADKSYQCYYLLLCWQIGKNIVSEGKIGKESLKLIATLLNLATTSKRLHTGVGMQQKLVTDFWEGIASIAGFSLYDTTIAMVKSVSFVCGRSGMRVLGSNQGSKLGLSVVYWLSSLVNLKLWYLLSI